MAKKSSLPVNDHDAFQDSVERLQDEIKVLRQCIDELHETFRWAVHNGRVHFAADHDEDHSKATTKQKSLEQLEVNDAVQFEERGQPQFGEIVDLDDGRNRAMVQLIPRNQVIEVQQDRIERIKPDPLSGRVEEWDHRPAESPAPPTPPGQLF
jgi:hypothetical protein